MEHQSIMCVHPKMLSFSFFEMKSYQSLLKSKFKMKAFYNDYFSSSKFPKIPRKFLQNQIIFNEINILELSKKLEISQPSINMSICNAFT